MYYKLTFDDLVRVLTEQQAREKTLEAKVEKLNRHMNDMVNYFYPERRQLEAERALDEIVESRQ